MLYQYQVSDDTIFVYQEPVKMAVKYFHGKKEHSTTYAAASFLMPGAAARVEAIRAKKRKLKHASPPPEAVASEVAPAVEHVKEPIEEPEPEAEVPEQEQQADIPVALETVPTNHGEDQEPRSDSKDTDSAMSIAEGAVPEAATDPAEQCEAAESIVGPSDSIHEHIEESALPAATETLTNIPDSLRDAGKTTESHTASGAEATEVEESNQADESDPNPAQEAEQSKHQSDTNHDQAEAVDSKPVGDSTPTQDDPAPEVDSPAERQEVVSDSTSLLSEQFESVEGLINAERAVHDQRETQTSSGSAKSPGDRVRSTGSPDVDNTVENDEPATSDKNDADHSPVPSSRSSPSRHVSIKTSEFEWLKRHEFD